ncbi:MAG: hypothetical protein AMJ90_06395 [candidate division Zixibacteria bacterium SM23_73_2]|nr:MAG: hypothetical protein AMJ90_06395 [candidate division Zixibacteria bacterium SM23_73_2]
MRFEEPSFVYSLFLLIPILIFFYLYVSVRKKALKQRFASPQVIDKLLPSYSPKKQGLKVFFILLAVLFLGVSLARPQFGEKQALIKRKGVDVIIALDVSLSMLAEDVKPNRLEKAKLEVSGLIDRLKGDRVGLVAFAGESFIQCPLTLDLSSAKMFLDIMVPDLIPIPGTAIGDAIRTARSAFSQEEKKFKVLVLITDGEDHDSESLEVAEEAKEEGIIIYTIGIGTPYGEPIPLKDEKGKLSGFKKDEKEEVVLSRLDESTLKKIAQKTGGKYFRATAGEIELDKIYGLISVMEKKELEGKMVTQYQERYQYFLVLSLFFLALEIFISEKKRNKKRGEGIES